MTTKGMNWCILLLLIILAILFLLPVLIVLMNSFKGQFYISTSPLSFPNQDTFVGLLNYKNGIVKTDFFRALAYSLWITVASTILILLGTSMTAWFLLRWKNKWSKVIYYALLFSMVVPFQMVMFTMSKTANVLYL